MDPTQKLMLEKLGLSVSSRAPFFKQHIIILALKKHKTVGPGFENTFIFEKQRKNDFVSLLLSLFHSCL